MPRNATLGNFGFNSAKGLRVEPYPRSEKVTWNWASLGFIRLVVNSPPTISPPLDKFYFGCSKLFKIFLFCPYFMLDRFKRFLWKHMRSFWTSGFIHLGTALPPHRIQSSIKVLIEICTCGWMWTGKIWRLWRGNQNMTSMKRNSKCRKTGRLTRLAQGAGPRASGSLAALLRGEGRGGGL